MEFNEKLQFLRKQRNLTQDELEAALYVSRTAISKWESSRGYPSIDSLKAISAFFSVSIDELLSSKEVLTIAEEDVKEKEARFDQLLSAVLDCGFLLLVFLPCWGQQSGGMVQNVPLWQFDGIQTYLKAAYWLVILAIVLFGVWRLVMQNKNCKGCQYVSCLLNAAAILLFTISRQPYGAVFAFVLGLIRGYLLFKQR